MNTLVATAMAFGGLAGLGVYVILRAMMRSAPALSPALHQLRTPPERVVGDRVGSFGRWAATHLGGRLHPPLRELRLIGKSTDQYVVEKLGFPLVGLLFPPTMTFLLSVAGIQLSIAVPLVASLGLAVLFFFLVDISVRQKAATHREEFIRAVAVYLGLVALERSASHGPVESLERAAAVGTGWVFTRIQETLDGARLAGIPPWDGLIQVAEEIGVPELADVGDIMRLSGNEGAQVYQTLVSRAQSLKVALRTKDQDRANTETVMLYIPTSLTVMVLFVLAGYPLLIRLATT